MKEKLVSVDVLWNALREVACSTKPFTDAKCIIQLKKSDIQKAFDKLHVQKEK